VTLCDPEIVNIRDLGSNFYLNESHVGKSRRDEATAEKFAELNPYVKVDVHQLDSVKNLASSVKNYDIVVITEMLPRDLLEAVDAACRENKCGFIYSVATGVSGFAFVDFGAEHIVRDANGEECKEYIIRTVSNDNPGIVLIDDTIGKGKLDLEDGDWVCFREVEGMTELNDRKPREIKYVSPIAFSIGDTRGYGEYAGKGIVEQVKVNKAHSYGSLKERFDSPYNGNKVPDPLDLSKFGRNELLHCGFIALHRFYSENDRLPYHNHVEDTDKVVAYAKEYYNHGKAQNLPWANNAAEFSDAIIANLAKWSRSHIVPVTSFLGGVVAQEIVKFTGKYTPIDQWLWFDFFETVENLNPTTDRTLNNTRYDDQIAIFGNELQEKLFNMNVFMIGAGALGCEFLKEFALMGISTKQGLTTVTDNDNIEISNLNRQFLFRRDDVSHPKSKTACDVVKKMNSEYKCKDLQLYVAPETENIFDDKFWNTQDCVINAVDNVKARRYIDSRCTWFGKPLIDSGTLGTKAHVQLIYPQVTSCYNDTQDPQEEGIPMCTLHNFPATIEHCIEWGRNHFTEFFTDMITDARKLIADAKLFYSDLKKDGNITFQLEKLSYIKKLILLALSQDFEKCIEFAVDRYTENFDHKIQQLLHNFPEDYTNKDGSKFWSGSKRVPHYLRFDPNHELQLQFVASYAILLADSLSIKSNKNLDYIRGVAGKVKINDFTPKNVKIKVNDTDTDDHNFGKDEENQLASLINELSIYDSTKHNPAIFRPHDFEKDDDTNYHIDFIHSCSNLRAENYTIQVCDRQKTKMIAGRIIPAIATTTAAITGLVALQIYTLLQTNKIDFMRNVFMNLAVNLFVLTEPSEKVVQKDKDYDPFLLGPVKAIPEKWSIWDKLVIDGPITVKEFINYLKDKYKVDVSIIASNNVTIVQTFQKSNADRYDKKIEDIYCLQKKIRDDQKYLVVDVSADTEDGSTALLPLVQYNFRK
jgi:ubiquitin-activating enzyme E1